MENPQGQLPLKPESEISRRYPVTEIFGPTIQGEGVDQGLPVYFVRFGGCDYRCDWCDTPYAVLPNLVRLAQRLTANEIVERVAHLAPGPQWVVLSGGNPALLELWDVVSELHVGGYYVSLETQGTKWKPWISLCDRVAVSPKPLSSGEVTDWAKLDRFLREMSIHKTFLKVVVLDQRDYGFASEVHRRYPQFPMFVSACNDAGKTVGNPRREDTRSEPQVKADLLNRGRTLANKVMTDPLMCDVRVQVQNHVLYWGNSRGY